MRHLEIPVDDKKPPGPSSALEFLPDGNTHKHLTFSLELSRADGQVHRFSGRGSPVPQPVLQKIQCLSRPKRVFLRIDDIAIFG